MFIGSLAALRVLDSDLLQFPELVFDCEHLSKEDNYFLYDLSLVYYDIYALELRFPGHTQPQSLHTSTFEDHWHSMKP